MIFADIKQHYSNYLNKWVLIEFTQLDSELQIVEGRVIAYSPHK